MLRIKLLKLLYGDDNCDFLLQKVNKDCLNYIGSFLCKGYTLNNETIYNIKVIQYKPYTYDMFKDMSQEEIDEQKRYYDVGQNVGIGRNTNPPSKTFLKDMYAYEEHLEYLLKIKRINKENNGKVKDVIAFLDHLQYIYD